MLSSNVLNPGAYVDVDNSKANTSLAGNSKTVFIGQKHASGTANAEEFIRVYNRGDAALKTGNGSNLDEMFAKWFQNNQFNEVYMIALDDNSGTAREETLTFTGTATAAGTIYLYINGRQLQISVSKDDTPTDQAAAVVVAVGSTINENDYPVTSSSALGVVTFVAKNEGTVGNQIKLKLNVNDLEELPAGVSAVFATSVAGATDPAVADAIAAFPDSILNWIVMPYVDSTSTGVLTDELTRRWGQTVQLNGQAYIAQGGSESTVVTFGDTLNSEHLNICDAAVDSPMADYLWSSAVAGIAASEIETDPARPIRTLKLVGITGDTLTNRRNDTATNNLLHAGVQTVDYLADGSVSINRTVTSYKKNAVGVDDNSYQEMNTVSILAYMRETLIAKIESEYPRHKLANDGTTFGSGQPIATPSVIADTISDLYLNDWIAKGIAEDLDSFQSSLSVTRHPTERTRVVAVLQPILVSPFYQTDATLQFIL